MVGPERPAVDKLLAEVVLVPDVKAAEDLNLRPLAIASAVPKPHAVPRASSAAELDFRRADCAFSRHGEIRSESWPVWPEST